MRYHSVRSAIGIVVAALVLSGTTTEGQGRRPSAVERIEGRDAIAGEAIVKFRTTPARADLQHLGQQHDLDRLERAGRAGAWRIRSRSRSAADLLQRLAADPNVEYVEPNYVVQAVAQPDDPQFPQLWGLLNTGQTIKGVAGTPGADIHASDAWNLSVGSKDYVVAVIDTGVDYTHPDLATNIWSAPDAFSVTIAGMTINCPKGSHGFNAIALNCDPMDDNVHGTHVSGTIGAIGNNGVGVTGVNWTASIMASKFLDAGGSGSLADALNAIDFVIQTKQLFASTLGANVRVLSNSWGGGGFSQAMLDEINLANANDMLFVAAAGNNGLPNDSFKFYPASYNAPNVIAVAATNNQDGLASFSNYGAATVHLGAPGVDVTSTAPNNSYLTASGTSMATPHVSGAAMLVLSRCALSTADLKATILSSAEPVPALDGKTVTGGRLDVNGAMRTCLEPPATPVLSNINGDRQAILTWTGGTGSTSFTVKRSLTSGGPYIVAASGIRTKSYTDGSLTNGTTYYYVVNGANSFGDGPLSNEVAATPHAPADLVIAALTAPGTGGAGLPLTMTVTVKNQGAGNSDPSTARVYYSDDTFVSASDTPLGAIATPALAAGASFSATLTAALPTAATTGQHFVVAMADADKTNPESNETNNTLSRSLLVGSDLVVTSWTAPSSAAPGATISITDTITNQGGATAPTSTTRYYLSVNAGLDDGDTLLAGGRTVPELAPGAASTGTASITLPSDIGAGSYYLFAKADGDNVVTESQEWNNTTLKLISIGGDLVISSFTGPASGGPGLMIMVTDTTANTGSASIAASTTRFYLSANAGLDASDTLLDGSHSVPALAAGASHTSSTWLTIPASYTTGSFYLFAKADADNLVPETNESNNTSARMIQIGSDLVISSITIPTKGGAGLPLTISDTTTNQGAAATPPTQTRYYLSTNLSLDSSDTPLSPARDVPALAPGQSSSGSVTVTLPANAPSGTLYILAQADGGNAAIETSETNNVAFRSLQVGPDLVTSVFTGPSKAGAGLAIDVTDTVANQGAGAAAASTVRYYISPNVLLDNKATLFPAGRAVAALQPGQTSTGTTTLTIPASMLAGSYFLIAAADGDALIPEAQESNNTAARSIAVGPDLIVSGLGSPASAPAGATFTVSDAVTNQGAGAADATTTRFYLSTNVLFDASDVLLTGGRGVPALAPGAASTGSAQVTIPAGTAAGNYFLLAVTDGDNVVRESSETNNALARAIQITAN
jgi:subtilisin family serine protease/uncharacterized membrane protein